MNDWKLWGATAQEKIVQVEASAPGTQFYLFSTKWTNPIDGKKRRYDTFVKIWWGPNGNGYTYDLNEAGLYTREQILESGSHFAENTYPLPKELVDAGKFGKVMRSVFN